jgi:flagellar basal-body rod protein FlgC
MQALVLRARKLTSALNPRQLTTLALAFAAAVALVVGVSWWLNAPDYRVLFADMEPEEAARVEAGLKGEKVPYQLTNGGRDVEVAAVVEDQSPARRRFEPSHPDADKDGYVTLPNVDPAEEMVDMLSAARAYQANLTAIGLIRDLVQRALDLGRG